MAKIEVVMFDCDSTLSQIEGIDYLAKRNNCYQEVAHLTNLAMNGELDFADVFAKRLQLIKPTKRDLFYLGVEYIKNLTPGAEDLLARLIQSGKQVYIISGGYKKAITALALKLNIPVQNVYGVELDFDAQGNYLAYNADNPLARNGGKAEVVSELGLSKVAFVGDGATDLEVMPYVDMFIGFGGVAARTKVRGAAHHFLEENDLVGVWGLINN